MISNTTKMDQDQGILDKKFQFKLVPDSAKANAVPDQPDHSEFNSGSEVTGVLLICKKTRDTVPRCTRVP